MQPRERLPIRLGDLLAQFIQTDITGDAVIDLRDLLRFSPANASHRAALNFDYQRLSTPDANDHSILGALRAGDEATLNALLDAEFGHTLSRFPAPDSRYASIRVTLARSGEGAAAAPGNVLMVDSALPEGEQVASAYLTKDAAQTLVLTATPSAQSQVLAWTGCDWVSNDRAQCTIGLAGSRDLVVAFGGIDSGVPADVLDLSEATNTLYPNLVDVVANAADAELIARLAQVQAGDYIVGATGDGFLRRVIAVEPVDAAHYRLETVDATLAEVVGTGGGGLSRALTNGDLRGYLAPTARSAARVGVDAFTGLEGIRLVPSADPADPVFRLELGAPGADAAGPTARAAGSGPSIEVTLFENSDGKITASGSVDISIDVDTSASYCGLFCLEEARFIVKPQATTSLSLNITGTIQKAERDIPLGSFSFAKLYFVVGGVPVWVTPRLDLSIGFEGTIEAEWTPGIEFTQVLEGGFVYDRVRGFDWIGNGDFDTDPDWLDIALIGEARLPYLRMVPSLKIYDAAGPALPLETYLKLRAEFDRQWNSEPCDGLLRVSALWGISSNFKWDLSGGSKLGEFLHLDQLEEGTEVEIKAFEWPLKTWYPQVSCSNFPYLQVDGPGILASVAAGTQSTLTSTVRLTNKGGVELPWHVDYIDDNPIQVTPDRGNLAAGASVNVSVQVATGGLNPGIYSNPLIFTNDYDTRQPDSKTGTSERSVRVQVKPALSTAPVLTSATYVGPGRVQLAWTFDPATSPVPIDGFRIDTSTDGGVTWTQTLLLADAAARSAQVGGLPQGTVWLRVAAYASDTATPVSNVRAVDVLAPPPPPVGTSRLNDTGIDWCANGSSNNLACPVDGYPWQDAQDGRDKTHDDDSDGHAGFSFTKLDANGSVLPANATSWSCVRDNVSGLVWEVKTDDGGLRDKDWTYSWYNPDAGTNGGSAGYSDYGNNCFNSARCDTDKFVADVNAAGLCGARDWRLPDPRELMFIVDNSRFNPSIDTAWFPRTVSSWFWSSSPYADYSYAAWIVPFSYGNVYGYYKYYDFHVRLVRGGQ